MIGEQTALKQDQWEQAAGSQDFDEMCITMQNIYAQHWKIKAMRTSAKFAGEA